MRRSNTSVPVGFLNLCVMLSESSSSDEEEALLLWSLQESKKKMKRKHWVHPINSKRGCAGEFNALFSELLEDEERFFTYFRMSINSFNELYSLIKNDIEKQDTNWRKAIPAKERLGVFLRYLATGDSFKTIGHSYRMGFTTVGVIVKEVSEVIWKYLQPIYLPFPTETIWKQSESEFHKKWGFPNCVGSIDGKHVSIKCPPNSGTIYFGYKQKFSIVLLAIVDSDYKFIMIDVGSYGKDSDSTIFQSSSFYQKLIDNQLNIPGPKSLPGREQQTPHVFIGDGGFKLEPFLMRPFPNDVAIQDERKLKFNKRLSSARRIVESCFGILVQKWRCFLRPFELNVDTVVDIVKAASCLHNFLRVKGEIQLQEQEDIDAHRHAHALRNFRQTNARSSLTAYAVREQFISYFNNE